MDLPNPETRTARIHAPAKVNLALRVLAREENGFHQLETVLTSLEMGDTVVLSPTRDGVSLVSSGPPPCPEVENLAYRAAEGFFERSGVRAGATIRLEKRIPVKAGLGGGSSDGAATLRGLHHLFPGALSDVELLDLASSLGSDVPFFLCPSPLALAWGRGQRLLALDPLPVVPVLLALPPVEVDTGEAYGMLARSRAARPRRAGARMHSLHALSSWEGVGALAHNDFEEVILSAFPPLGRVHEAMKATAPFVTLLSGSGAALFSLYATEVEAEAGRKVLQAEFPEVRFALTRTLERVPDPSPQPGG